MSKVRIEICSGYMNTRQLQDVMNEFLSKPNVSYIGHCIIPHCSEEDQTKLRFAGSIAYQTKGNKQT